MNARDVLASLRLENGEPWIDQATDWQLADALAVIEGDRPYSYFTRSRGGSKTTDLAGVALAMLLTAPDRSRLYWLAADADQGQLAIDAIAGFAIRTPTLAGRVEVQARRVMVTATGSTLDVLPADAPGAWGLRPVAVFVDELANWHEGPAARRLFDAATSAVAKDASAKLVILTTAGDPAHFARGVLDHVLADPLWHVHEVTGPPPWLDPERLAEQRRRLPESMYARLFENRWVTAEDRLTSPEQLAACVTLDGPQPPQGDRDYAIGLDIGLKRDRTAAMICHAEPLEGESEAGARIILDRVGVWKGSRLHPVKLAEVEEWIAEASRQYRSAEVCMDPWQGAGLAQRLRGRGLAVTEFNFSAQSAGRLGSTLHLLIREQALALPDDRELLDELAHVRLGETSPGVLRLEHDASHHDDQAVSLALAAVHLLGKPQSAGVTAGPMIWGTGGVSLGNWHPEHVHELHPHRRDHERTVNEMKQICPGCQAERQKAKARREAPPPPPRRAGKFLIHESKGDRR